MTLCKDLIWLPFVDTKSCVVFLFIIVFWISVTINITSKSMFVYNTLIQGNESFEGHVGVLLRYGHLVEPARPLPTNIDALWISAWRYCVRQPEMELWDTKSHFLDGGHSSSTFQPPSPPLILGRAVSWACLQICLWQPAVKGAWLWLGVECKQVVVWRLFREWF